MFCNTLLDHQVPSSIYYIMGWVDLQFGVIKNCIVILLASNCKPGLRWQNEIFLREIFLTSKIRLE